MRPQEQQPGWGGSLELLGGVMGINSRLILASAAPTPEGSQWDLGSPGSGQEFSGTQRTGQDFHPSLR